MTRQRFDASTEYPTAGIRSRGTGRNRRSDKLCDTKEAKRVRFDDKEADNKTGYASLRAREMTESSRADVPKTSEYAYFRNIKNRAVHGRSYSHHKENRQLKGSKTNRIGREDIKPSDMLKPSTNGPARETVGHFDHPPFLTPPVSKRVPSHRDNKDLANNLLSENATPIDLISSLSTLSKASEQATLTGDLETNAMRVAAFFSAKRRRLWQWAHNSISEVELLHPEGVGFVSSLLTRLYPKGDHEDLFYLHGPTKRETGNGGRVPAFHESRNLEERLNLYHIGEWETELPKIWFGGSRDKMFLEHDNTFTRSPFTNCGIETHFQDEMTDLHSKSRKSRYLDVEHDFAFCLPFERYGNYGSCYLKEVDGSCLPIVRKRKEPHRFLLKWDFEEDGASSSITGFDPPAKISPGPGLSASWNVNYQQIEDDVEDAKAYCSPPLFSNHYLKYKSIQNFPSSSRFTPDLIPNFDDVNFSAARPDMLSLTFPVTPKCITLAENTNAECLPYGSNIIFSHDDQLWLQNKTRASESCSDVLQERFHGADFFPRCPSIFRTWQFSQVDDSLCSFSIPEEAPKEPFTLFSQGTIHNYSWLLNFPSFLDSVINRPLLDNVGNSSSDREVYFDDDNKWNYIVNVVP